MAIREPLTVAQVLEEKYRVKLLTMSERDVKRLKETAQCTKQHPAEILYMSLEITENDIKENGGWYGPLHTELLSMHEQKLSASNKHRQERGHFDRYWLTKKGFKALDVIYVK